MDVCITVYVINYSSHFDVGRHYATVSVALLFDILCILSAYTSRHLSYIVDCRIDTERTMHFVTCARVARLR